MVIKLVYLLFLFPYHVFADVGTFWHVTDFHLDQNYSETGDTLSMCWEVGESLRASPGQFGDYACDSPEILINSTIDAMQNIWPSPDFVIWTGDDTSHVSDSFFSTDIVVDIIGVLTNALTTRFPNTAFVSVLGNHDFYPKHQAPPGNSVLQSRVADLWKHWLDDFGAYDQFAQNGFYTAPIPNSVVTVVAVNTLLWYINNDITSEDPTASDPGMELEWLRQTLNDIRTNGRKAYLMGHIPPGTFERYLQTREGFHWYQERYNQDYNQIVQDYSDVIKGQFYAHHHTDSFRVFLSNTTIRYPMSFALIAPGVSPMKSTLSPETGANNPAIRLVSYERTTGEIVEVSTYYLDLALANSVLEDNWQFEYNLTQILELNSINADELHQAALRLWDDRLFFNQYYPVNTVMLEPASNCSGACQKTQFCAITEIEYQDFFDCNILFPQSVK